MTSGLQLDDPALARAVGPEVSGRARIDLQEGAPLRIGGLQLAGDDYGVSGNVVIAVVLHNSLGLAAGYDKDGEGWRGLAALSGYMSTWQTLGKPAMLRRLSSSVRNGGSYWHTYRRHRQLSI